MGIDINTLLGVLAANHVEEAWFDGQGALLRVRLRSDAATPGPTSPQESPRRPGHVGPDDEDDEDDDAFAASGVRPVRRRYPPSDDEPVATPGEVGDE